MTAPATKYCWTCKGAGFYYPGGGMMSLTCNCPAGEALRQDGVKKHAAWLASLPPRPSAPPPPPIDPDEAYLAYMAGEPQRLHDRCTEV